MYKKTGKTIKCTLFSTKLWNPSWPLYDKHWNPIHKNPGKTIGLGLEKIEEKTTTTIWLVAGYNGNL